MKNRFVMLLFMLSATSLTATAEEKPFQLSLTPDIAIHPDSTTIKGISLNIWGQNQQRALTLGIVNGSTGNSSGFSFGLLSNYADNYTGAHLAPVNYAGGNFKGAQLGFVNYSEHFEKGLQLGFINYTETMTKGIQIGLVNIIRNNRTWFKDFPDQIAPAMVLVNWRF